MSIYAKCLACKTKSEWPECSNCKHDSWRGQFNPEGLSSVECKNCGHIEYPPIKCYNCFKNINYQFWKYRAKEFFTYLYLIIFFSFIMIIAGVFFYIFN